MSSIQVVKLSMGFQSADQRDGCKNCRYGEVQYVDRMPPYDRAGWRCKKGCFMTSPMAICKQHEPKPTTRSAA